MKTVSQFNSEHFRHLQGNYQCFILFQVF